MSPGSLFDAHLHIIDPRFPLVANQGYCPPPFTTADYRRATAGLGITGGVVVSGSYQGTDPEYLIAALSDLGPGFVGVTQLPDTVSDGELDRLHAAGVRGQRFNFHRGTCADASRFERQARRAYDRNGWHVELYAGAATLADLEATIARLPAVSIDHLGLEAAAQPTVRRLVAAGVQVKATGFGRVDFDVATALTILHRENPAALMFGTDLPSTRAARPFVRNDIDLFEDALGADAAASVLCRNARAFYRMPATPEPENHHETRP